MAANTIVVISSDNGPTAWPAYYKNGGTPPGSTNGLRGRKWSLYEGGIREPLIVRWPGHVAAGRVDKQSIVQAIDLMPTLLAMADAPRPAASLHGRGLSKMLLQGDVAPAAPLFWFYPNDIKPGKASDVSPELALRDGDWKLLMNRDRTGVQLYNLSEDPDESIDRSVGESARVGQMRDQLAAWFRQMYRPREIR